MDTRHQKSRQVRPRQQIRGAAQGSEGEQPAAVGNQVVSPVKVGVQVRKAFLKGVLAGSVELGLS